ncbi:MAG TPA: acyl-CoA dehydrogenase family protein [Pseudonocardiaceae bacterium]
MTTTASAAGEAATVLGFDDIMGRVRRFAPTLRDRVREIEELRRLPADVVEGLRDCGVFRAAMPAEWGGPELTSMEQLEIVEELSRFDGSVGWCAMIGMDSGIYAGFLQPEVARATYPRLDMITAGLVLPVGQAHETEGGVRVTGRWRFGSGCTHADRMIAGCLLFRDGAPVIGEHGAPVWLLVMAEQSEYTIHDTWHTTGLAGTGSHDYSADDLFVPSERVFSLVRPVRDSPLHRRSDSISRKMSGVPLGVARAAIDYVMEQAETRVDYPATPWKESRRIKIALGECEMRLAVARSAVYSSVEAMWNSLAAGQDPSREVRATAALARFHCFRSCREITRILYELVGGDSLYRDLTPLDRYQRDLTTACQHFVAQDRILEMSGGLLLGEEPNVPLL